MSGGELDLDALEALLDAATDGPWTWLEQHGRDHSDEGWSYVAVVEDDGRGDRADAVAMTAYPGGPDADHDAQADAALIAALRNAAPALITAARDRDRWRDEFSTLMATDDDRSRWVLEAQQDRDAARAKVIALRERVEAALTESGHSMDSCLAGYCPDCGHVRAALATGGDQ